MKDSSANHIRAAQRFVQTSNVLLFAKIVWNSIVHASETRYLAMDFHRFRPKRWESIMEAGFLRNGIVVLA
jgi:hypothetical protein